MEKHKYMLLKGRWGISISIFGEVYDKRYFGDECIVVHNGIYLSFSKNPLIKNEIFCEEDRTAIFKAIDMVSEYILLYSQFRNNTVIQICSLQYSLCYYQEEAMLVAMLNWCAETFNFELQEINTYFDNTNNKYIFDLSAFDRNS
ncbi:MAG: hypothetical protein ACI4HQ_12825 [Acetatifactor sp.]